MASNVDYVPKYHPSFKHPVWTERGPINVTFDKARFARDVEQRVAERGWTQKAFLYYAGLNRHAYYEMLYRRKHSPGFTGVARIAYTLGLDLNDYIKEEPYV